MNTIVNDNFLSLSTRPNPSQGGKTSSRPDENQEVDTATERRTGEDSLELSSAGQRLQQSISIPADISRSVPETQDQAKALVARIRQQFEQTTSNALSAHSAIKGSQMDMLLRSAPA